MPSISFIIISKDEPMLADTLAVVCRQAASLEREAEVVVVDASNGRLEQIHRAYPQCNWIDFRPPDGARISIPHQRNAGVNAAGGNIVVFTDSGCLPSPGWASALLAPLLDGTERVTVGRTTGRGAVDLYDATGATPPAYVAECPTINMAFRRDAFEAVAGFDESFEYGSDVDFSWRLVDAGLRLRSVPDAVVTADWGTARRQLRRAWSYGRARASLYRKHRGRIRTGWRNDPVPFVYGAFLLALPLTLVFPAFPALLVIPALRNRRTRAALTIADHLVLGAGFLRELSGL
jgi:cellulose synthase/poly-beta-1,6-N-acetylglucosamine synthase-like glycosyltransferase